MSTQPKPLTPPQQRLHVRLVAALASHHGAQAGISAAALARELCTSEREMRAAVSRARYCGVAVCAHPRHGYYMAATEEELRTCTRFLERRAVHSMVMLARIRAVALPVLAGQLFINQA